MVVDGKGKIFEDRRKKEVKVSDERRKDTEKVKQKKTKKK